MPCIGRIETLHGNTVEAVQTAPFDCTGAVNFQFDVTARGAGGRSTSRQGGTVALTATKTVLGRIATNQSGSAVLIVSALPGSKVQCQLDYNVDPTTVKSQPTDLR